MVGSLVQARRSAAWRSAAGTPGFMNIDMSVSPAIWSSDGSFERSKAGSAASAAGGVSGTPKRACLSDTDTATTTRNNRDQHDRKNTGSLIRRLRRGAWPADRHDHGRAW